MRARYSKLVEGETFGFRVVGKIVGRDDYGRSYWSWSCSCGNSGKSYADSLKRLRAAVACGESPGWCLRCAMRATSERRREKKHRCGHCGAVGHDRRTCHLRRAPETRPARRSRGPCERVSAAGAPCRRELYHNGACSFLPADEVS